MRVFGATSISSFVRLYYTTTTCRARCSNVAQLHTSWFSRMSSTKFNYPSVRRDDTLSYTKFNVEVSDPYQWLEDVESEETQKFVAAQNAISEPYIKSCSQRDLIRKRLRELYEFPRYCCPFRKGDNYFSQENTGLQNQYVYYIFRGGLDAKPEVFLDPNKLSEDGTVSLQDGTSRFSDDGKWFVYGLSSSGSDWVSVKIKNVDTGVDLDEELTRIKFSNISWTLDNKGFFYSYYPNHTDKFDGTETTECSNQKLFYHRLGTSQSEDILIHENPDKPNQLFSASVSDCGQYLWVSTRESCEGNSLHYYRFEDPLNPRIEGKLCLVPVVSEITADYHYITNNGPIHFFLTNRNAPNYRVIMIDLINNDTLAESKWKDLIKEHSSDVLDSVTVVRDNVLVCQYIRNVVSVIELRRLTDGSLIKVLNIPYGTVVNVRGERKYDEIFFSFTSFVKPGVIYYLKLDDKLANEPTIFKEVQPKNFDSSKFVTSQVFYQSKDGTRIPMFIVHNKDLKKDGSRPCMLYGYGGFNISLQPWFSVQRLILMDHLDGVFALPNIRGGGEYGKKWHNGGRLMNKQNCFDDFAAAAEYLIQEGYTSPDKLIIEGGSNGGLLVGAVSNQRPDLFGCAIAHVGVMDMLRFHKFTIGRAWTSDYGNPDEEEHFHNLIRFSPVHTVPDSVTRYPATLLLTADHDDRVVPLHSYKFIAQLQHKLGASTCTPLMIRIETKAGHGSGKPTEKIIEEYSDIYSFIINSLSLEYKC